MKAAIQSAGSKWPVFLAGVYPHGLLRQVQIVRSGSGVYRGAGFQFKRCELLFGIGFHVWPLTQQHRLGMHKLFAGQGLPSKYWNHAATRMDAGFSGATVALSFLALFALSI